MTLVSFLTSVLLFYFGTVAVATLMSGTLTGIGVLYVANPVMTLLSIPIFIGLWAIVHMILTERPKKGAKTLLVVMLALIVITPAFTVCLASGVFDSLTMSNDSYIDLYRCTVFLYVQNVGFKDVAITNVTVGNLVWVFSGSDIARGENMTLTLVYAHPDILIYWLEPENIIYDGPYCLNGTGVDPTTFQEGKIYGVKIQTDGPTFTFQVKATYLSREDIQGINAKVGYMDNQTEGNETYCLPEMYVQFNTTSWSFVFIHSITVGPLTLTFEQPILVVVDPSNGHYGYLDLDFYGPPYGQYRALVPEIWPNGEIVSATANQPLTSPVFSLGKTYSLTVCTMENNYTTTVTMEVT
jgi:hypothetical protein